MGSTAARMTPHGWQTSWLPATSPCVTHHVRNPGIGGAFHNAGEYAQGEWTLLIPADLTLHPNEQRGYFEVAPVVDIIVGLRSDRSDYTLLRWLIEVVVRYTSPVRNSG